VRARLSAASRHEYLALYDPAAIPETFPLDPDLETPEPEPPPRASLDALATSGDALFLRIASEDCEADFRVLVDEAPDGTVQQRGKPVLSNARLRLPGGRLRADGVEFICRPGQVRVDAAGSATEVPPGEYAVEVVELLTWKLRSSPGEVRRGATRFERIAHALSLVYLSIGVLMLPLNLFGGPMAAVYAHGRYGWKGVAFVAAGLLALDVVVFGGFWLLEAAQRRFPALARVREIREKLDEDNPDIVVVLRPARAGAGPAQPAIAEIDVAG
jgi:hypothetical protein